MSKKSSIDLSGKRGGDLFAAFKNAVEKKNTVIESRQTIGERLAAKQRQAEYDKIKRELSWHTDALVQFLSVLECQCGAVHTAPDPQTYIRQRIDSTAARFQPAKTEDLRNAELERTTIIRRSRVTCCPTCFQRLPGFSNGPRQLTFDWS